MNELGEQPPLPPETVEEIREMTAQRIAENINNMSDEDLVTLGSFFPDYTMTAQAVQEEREKDAK